MNGEKRPMEYWLFKSEPHVFGWPEQVALGREHLVERRLVCGGHKSGLARQNRGVASHNRHGPKLGAFGLMHRSQNCTVDPVSLPAD